VVDLVQIVALPPDAAAGDGTLASSW